MFSVASLDNLIWQIGVKSRSQVMERCVVLSHSSRRSRQQQCFGMYSLKPILSIGRYHFGCKDLTKVFSYLVQVNHIFNQECPSQARSLLKFITHLHKAKVFWAQLKKIFWHKVLYISCITYIICFMYYFIY